MKKLLVFILSGSFIFCFLCGCSAKEVFSAHRQEYLISAMGFDFQDGEIRLYLEAVIINTEDADSQKQLVLIEGRGETVSEALDNAYKKTTQSLLLSHCGAVVIGSDVSDEIFKEICDYCYNENELTLSVMLISADNAADILSQKAVSSIAVGYDIISMLGQQSERTGAEYRNRLYEVKSAQGKKLNIFTLPYFKVTENGYSFEGLTVYSDNIPVMRLDSREASLYAIATDTQTKGVILQRKNEISVKSSYAVYKFNAGNSFETVLTLDLRLGESGEENKNEIKKGIEELFARSKQYGTDIFGFGNILYHKQKTVWDTVGNSYTEHYKKSRLTVIFK